MEVQTLSTEQKARVFAMYIGCDMKSPGSKKAHPLTSIGKWPDGRWFLNVGYQEYGLSVNTGYKLLLRPLSAITDEDAVEVAKMFGMEGGLYINRIGVKATVYEPAREEFIKEQQVEIYGGIVSFWNGLQDEGEYYSTNPYNVMDFLRQRGYATKLFIAPGHPCNGMTAIEIGLAIDSTTI